LFPDNRSDIFTAMGAKTMKMQGQGAPCPLAPFQFFAGELAGEYAQADDYMSFFKNGVNRSIGTGKIVVEFFSEAISTRL